MEQMTLKKRSGEPIAEVYNYNDLVVEHSLTGVNEINFTISNVITTKQGETIDNYVYNLIDGNTMIEYQGDNYIVITPIETTSGNISTKEVVAYSMEYELKQRLIIGFTGEDRVMYDPSHQKDENGVYFGLLNYVENITDWRVKYYTPSTTTKKYSLDFDKVNLLNAITEAQKTFGFILQFDTINKTIDIMDIEQVGKDNGLYLSNENFIKELKKEVNDDNIITRVYCYGRDGVDISRVNITGKPYVEDFSYYSNTDYMSEELISNLESNKQVMDKYTPQYDKISKSLLKAEKEESGQLNGIRMHEGQLEVLYKEFDNVIDDPTKRAEIQRKILHKEQTIKDMKVKLHNIQTQILGYEIGLKDIARKVNIENNLTEESKKEINRFIREDVYHNTNLGKYNLSTLIDEGREMVQKVSKPMIQFTITLDELTEYVDEDLQGKIKLGDIVHIENLVVGEYFQVKLVGITQSKDGINLRFSSKEGVYDEEIFLDDILADSQNTTNTVDFSKFKWDKAQTVDSAFRDYIQNELNLANQGLVKAEGQRPVFDDRGLWLYKEDKNGNPLPEQIRAVNNIIAITKDNWQNVEVAITPEGVKANQLIGNVILGSDLKILSDSGVVEILENLITIRDSNGIPRVQLGQYEGERYGLKLTDSQGRHTVLDERGMLQVWQEGNVDNVDTEHPLEINIFLPNKTREIQNSILRFKRLKFRSYSKGNESNKTIVKPTGLATDVEFEEQWTKPGGEDGHQHSYMDVVHHKHEIEIPKHSHENIHGIYVGDTVQSNVKIYINGIDRTYDLSEEVSLNEDRDDLNITPFLEMGKWNSIKVGGKGLGRLDVSVYVEALIGYNEE